MQRNSPKLIGELTSFMASNYSKFITGETIYINGGSHIVGA